LKKGVVKDILDSSNIPVELLLGRLTKQMQNDLGLTEEAAHYAVESWAMVLDKMPPQQIQQPIIKPPTTISRNQQPILESTYPQPTEISQTRQIDYTNLERLLQAQNFKEADWETRKIMLTVANREKEGWLRIKDAEKFPCKELRSIDQLWLKYSRGKFGISVQQQIYQSLGGTKEYNPRTKEYNQDVWRSMGDRVAWRQGGKWLYYSDLNFSQTAPSGHLPSGAVVAAPSPLLSPLEWRGRGGRRVALGGVLPSLLSRHAECNT
jgi:hypothetical protein